MANELYTMAEFDLRRLILYDASVITKLNHMLNLEKNRIEVNGMEVKRQLESST